MLIGLRQGYINQIIMRDYGIRWVGPSIIPNKWRQLRIFTKPQYNYKQASISGFLSHGPKINNQFSLNSPV